MRRVAQTAECVLGVTRELVWERFVGRGDLLSRVQFDEERYNGVAVSVTDARHVWVGWWSSEELREDAGVHNPAIDYERAHLGSLLNTYWNSDGTKFTLNWTDERDTLRVRLSAPIGDRMRFKWMFELVRLSDHLCSQVLRSSLVVPLLCASEHLQRYVDVLHSLLMRKDEHIAQLRTAAGSRAHGVRGIPAFDQDSVEEQFMGSEEVQSGVQSNVVSVPNGNGLIVRLWKAHLRSNASADCAGAPEAHASVDHSSLSLEPLGASPSPLQLRLSEDDADSASFASMVSATVPSASQSVRSGNNARSGRSGPSSGRSGPSCGSRGSSSPASQSQGAKRARAASPEAPEVAYVEPPEERKRAKHLRKALRSGRRKQRRSGNRKRNVKKRVI